MKVKVLLALFTLLICGTLVGYIFWQQELKYALPTPIPVSYTPVFFEEVIRLPEKQSAPVFLHFFNPECPCSRFNRKHVNQLIFQFKDKIKFKVVIPSYASVEEARSFFDEDIEIISDTAGWALTCGVYSTPQAVIIDKQSKLYFRGNYNRTRYCTDPKTNYAELALQAFINNKPLPMMDELAKRAYGCSFADL
jgi:hypothetical protein